jgi:DNA-binding beta-propeller fold protein YncE
MSIIIAAGNGSPGSSSYMLDSPRGIFVNINFDLYVADCNNNRIQLFRTGQSNGTTKVENGMISLNCPTGVVLDADNYLFIVDSNNHRIIGSGPNGFRCVAGCSGSNGSSANHLFYPQSMAFDSYGNIFVTDRNNNRIQKFNYETVSCGEFLYINKTISTAITQPTTQIPTG